MCTHANPCNINVMLLQVVLMDNSGLKFGFFIQNLWTFIKGIPKTKSMGNTALDPVL